MHTTSPDSLSSVQNFTVAHEGVGSITWTEAVDVRGLELSSSITIQQGAVSVYSDGHSKPDEGQGLNKPANITLLGVHLKDKATGEPSANPEVRVATSFMACDPAAAGLITFYHNMIVVIPLNIIQ